MSQSHVVVRIDHQHAEVLQFDTEHLNDQKVKAQTSHLRQHGSNVRTEHEYFGAVCDAFAGLGEVLITGPHTAQSDFRHFVEKHRPALNLQIVGWEVVDHPSEGQLVALAREFFLKHDRVAGTTPVV
jgi:stalled ribosome rescue protein Dom34